VRTTSHHPAISPSRPSFLVLGIFWLAALVIYALFQIGRPDNPWAEDLPVYTQAASNFLAGLDPYSPSMAPLYFLYPPSFLFIAGAFSHLVPSHWGPALYVVFSVASLIAIPLVLARYYFRLPWLTPPFALLLFFASSRFTGMEALRTMNIASPLYSLAFIAAIPGLKSNRWLWFYLAVFLAAVIKITFLPLFLLPLLAGKRQWIASILCGAAVLAANLAEIVLWPSLYHGYLNSLHQGIIGQQAFGYGIFGLLAHHNYWQRQGAGSTAYAVSGVIALLLVGLMFRMRQKLKQIADSTQIQAYNSTWLALIVTTIILVNPRQMQYDMDIAVFAAFFLWVFALKINQLKSLLILMVLLFLPSLLMPFVISNAHLWGIYETFLCFAAFALSYWRLNREIGAETNGTAPQLAPA